MRLLPTTMVKDGAVLARDVLVGRPDGIPLLRGGARLTPAYRTRLMQAGIRAVYIADEYGEGIEPEPLVTPETRLAATRAVSAAFALTSKAMASKQRLAPATVRSLQETVKRILADVASSGGASAALVDLAVADAYIFQHSIDVTALGLLIGQRLLSDLGWVDYRGTRRFDRLEERLHMLGLGLLLHDVGMLALPNETIHRVGPLTEEEWKLVRDHPRTGVELLGSDDFSPIVKAIVLRHHERWDGSGYPDGKRGSEVHQFARIAAVADVYDAITSERLHAGGRPAHVGVRAILDGSGTLFDPEVVAVFARVVAPFPPGVELTLCDGRRAVVVSVPKQALDRPRVRIIDGASEPYELALIDEPELEIEGWERGSAPAAA